jgi:hypothetical protein
LIRTYPGVFVCLFAVFFQLSKLNFDLFILTLVECKQFTSPLPIEFALAIVFIFVVNTACTNLVVND